VNGTVTSSPRAFEWIRNATRAFAIALCASATAAAQTPTTETLAQVGVAAPGGVDVLGSVGVAQVSSSGHVAFTAGLQPGRYGLWLGQSGSFTEIARTWDPAPGMPTTIQFWTFSPVHLDASGVLYFRAALEDVQNGIENIQSFWRTTPTGLELLLSEGAQAPGFPAGVTIDSFYVQAAPNGTLAVKLQLVGTVPPARERAVAVGPPDDLEPLVWEGVADHGLPESLLDYGVYAVNERGEVFLSGSFQDPNDGGIAYLVGPGGAEELVRTGQIVSGLRVLGELSDIRLTAGGQVAFTAEVEGVEGSGYVRGLFFGRPGTLRGRLLDGNPVSLSLFANEAGELLLRTPTQAYAGTFSSLQPLGPSLQPWLLRDDGLMVLEARNPAGTRQLVTRAAGSSADTLLFTTTLPPSPDPPPSPLPRGIEYLVSDGAGRLAFITSSASLDPQQLVLVAGLPQPDDADLDGIADAVDVQYQFFSEEFSDLGLGGTTEGTILDRSDLELRVRPAVGDLGVIASTGETGLGSAVIASPCLSVAEVVLEADEVALIRCGSLSVEALRGDVDVHVGDDVLARVGAGARVRIAEQAPGSYLVEHTGAAGSLSVVDRGIAVELQPGDAVAVEAAAANQPPTAVAGPDATLEATSAAGASLALDASASSDPDPGDVLSYLWTGPFGTVEGVSPVVTLPLGSHVVSLTVSDAAGASDADTLEVSVVDTTPPELVVPQPLVIACAGLGPEGRGCVGIEEPAVAAWLDSVEASDLVTGVIPGYEAPARFEIGSNAVIFSATDAAGNSSNAIGEVSVVYGWGGFGRPLGDHSEARIHTSPRGRALPVKVRITCGGVAAPAATVRLELFDSAGVALEVRRHGGHAEGDTLRYDADEAQYVLPLSTHGLAAPGAYRIRVSLDDGTAHDAWFFLDSARSHRTRVRKAWAEACSSWRHGHWRSAWRAWSRLRAAR
jgi:hypothetical protein